MGFDLSAIGDAIGEGIKGIGGDAQNSNEKFNEHYKSSIEPKDGVFGDLSRFALEKAPIVLESNSIQKGDWKQVAIDVAAIGGMTVLEVAKTGLAMEGIVGGFVGEEVVPDAGAEVVEGLEQGNKHAPLEGPGGHWNGKRGNSMWKPDDNFVPLKTNPCEKTWSEIKKDYKMEGIKFENGEPDFSAISEGTVKIEKYSSSCTDNFDKADIELAKHKGVSPDEIYKYRKENKLTWHERRDMGTMDLVPSIVHGNISHSGGISEIKKLEELQNG